MIFIKRSELNRMANHILDDETEMTELDLFEYEHCFEDWEVIEDVKAEQAEEVKNDILAAEWQ